MVFCIKPFANPIKENANFEQVKAILLKIQNNLFKNLVKGKCQKNSTKFAHLRLSPVENCVKPNTYNLLKPTARIIHVDVSKRRFEIHEKKKMFKKK